MTDITAVIIPKWGLSMTEGTVVDWHKSVGDAVVEGDDLVDIETSKITNVAAAPAAGVLRRVTVHSGTKLPVGALIGIIAGKGTPDAEIDGFVEQYKTQFTVEKLKAEEQTGLATAMVDTRFGPVRIGQRGDGSGTPVVFLHGYASDMLSWTFNLDAFEPDQTIVAIDLPGHGASTKMVGDGSIAALSQAVQDVLVALDIDAAHLVGHSLGAAVALKVAGDMPGKIRRMVLIAPAGLAGSAVSSEFLDGLLGARRGRDLRPFLEMLVADPAGITRDMVDDVIKFKRLDGVDDALRKLRDKIVDGSQFAGLGDVLARVRPRIIVGSGDRIVGVPERSLLPEGVTLTVIDGVGHLPHLEKAADVNAILKTTIG
jgi:pyruvate dehydrogenase E2 component (dihydrolipoamide acetyltransferase)